MISEYNTTGSGSSNPGANDKMNFLFKVLIVGVALYFGYKYLIVKPTEEEKKQ